MSKGTAKTLEVLARAYQAQKNNAKADELLVKAIKTDPDTFDAYWLRSAMLVGEGKPAEGLKVAKQWLARPAVFHGFKSNQYRNRRVRHAASGGQYRNRPGRAEDEGWQSR